MFAGRALKNAPFYSFSSKTHAAAEMKKFLFQPPTAAASRQLGPSLHYITHNFFPSQNHSTQKSILLLTAVQFENAAVRSAAACHKSELRGLHVAFFHFACPQSRVSVYIFSISDTNTHTRIFFVRPVRSLKLC